MSDNPETAPRRGQMMRFRARGTRLSAESATRQGEVTHLAFLRLGGRDAAIEFLNNPDASLGGRPIDLAVASAEGAAKVIRAINRLADGGGMDQ